MGLKPELMIVLPDWDNDYHGGAAGGVPWQPLSGARAYKTMTGGRS